MIEEIEMYSAVCGKCGDLWDDGNGLMAMTQKEDLQGELSESEWMKGGDITPAQDAAKLYCPKCYHMNDDDQYVLNT